MLFGTDRGATGPGQEPGPSLQGGRRLRTELRDECLKLEIFYSLKEAQVVIGAWRDHYNRVRPHSSLGYRPPAPVTRAVANHLPTLPTMQSSHITRSKIPGRSPDPSGEGAFDDKGIKRALAIRLCSRRGPAKGSPRAVSPCASAPHRTSPALRVP